MYFLLFVVLASAIGTAMVLLRNRRPTTMSSSIDEFRRSLDAIAPEADDALSPPDEEGAQRPG